MAFVGLAQLLALLKIDVSLPLYAVKILVVTVALIVLWKHFDELHHGIGNHRQNIPIAVISGVLVYVLWVRMNWPWAMQGKDPGYNPFQAGGSAGYAFAGIRLLGAAVIVPIMEELFWRSFLLRYLVSSRFDTVPLGTFTPTSFLIGMVLFGLEHNLWLAGMMAGAVYSAVLYKTRNLWTCILSHGTTNFALGVHVLVTGEWEWW
jgi:CAAX prenyl protease-like protein